MGFSLSKFLGGTVAEPIEAIGNIIDAVHTNDEERAQAEAVLLKIKQHPALVQAEIGKVQAQHRSIFVAGARPFLMWVCGLGLGMAFIVNPLIEYFGTGEKLINMPLNQMMELTIAMLGLAAMRTVEKVKGVSR